MNDITHENKKISDATYVGRRMNDITYVEKKTKVFWTESPITK